MSRAVHVAKLVLQTAVLRVDLLDLVIDKFLACKALPSVWQTEASCCTGLTFCLFGRILIQSSYQNPKDTWGWSPQ